MNEHDNQTVKATGETVLSKYRLVYNCPNSLSVEVDILNSVQ